MPPRRRRHDAPARPPGNQGTGAASAFVRGPARRQSRIDRGRAHRRQEDSGRAVWRAERRHARVQQGRVAVAAAAARPHPGQCQGDPGGTRRTAMKPSTPPGRARVAALAAALALAGCANMSGIAPQSSLASPESVGLVPGSTASFRPQEQWWHEFGDERLDRLVTQALAGHPSLKLAQARLARAQAATESARSASGPQVNGSIDITRQRFTENGLFPPPIAGSTINSGTLQLSGSWELDFFGRNQAALEAALGASRAAEADTQAARVLLASNVVRAYLQLARSNDQLEVAQRTLAQREETLRLVRDRVNAGLDTQLELRQNEGALPDARQQIEALREQGTLAQHALAALTGSGNRDVVPNQPTLANLKLTPVPTQ